MGLFDPRGKVAVITGSSRGIGRAIAEAFADAGAQVVISRRKAQAFLLVARAINDRHGGTRALPIAASISDKAAIVVSSIGGLIGSDVIGAYNLSKAPTCSSSEISHSSLVRTGERINAIVPGVICTDFACASCEDPEVERKPWLATPSRRIGEPSEIGGAAIFLASPAGSDLTGQGIIVDGGAPINGGI